MGNRYNVWHLWEDKAYLIVTKASEKEADQLADRLQELSFQGKLPKMSYMALRSGNEGDLICKGRKVSEPLVDYQKVLQENS